MVLEKKEIKVALGLALLATVGAGVWAYYHSRKNEVTDKNEITEKKTAEADLISQNTFAVPKEIVTEAEQDRIGQENWMKFQAHTKPEKYTALISKLKPVVDQQKNSPILDIQMLLSINDALLELCSPKFTEIMQINRKARRQQKAQNNVLNYFQEVFGSMQKIEMMLMSNMQVVLNELEINPEKFKKSEEYWHKLNPQLALITLMILDKLKLMMPLNKECLLETALEIFDYQIEIYPTLKDVVTVEDPQLLPMTKQSWMADMIYEKFGMEEEDYMRTAGLDHNADFRTKAEKLGTMIQADSGMFADMMPGF